MFYKGSLNTARMSEAAVHLIGEHDFKGFCSANTATQNFVRTIYSIEITQKDEFIYVEVCGSGFLYNMVRIIVGTLVDYCLDKISKQDILDALKLGQRNKSGQTMPAEGLYLKETFY